MVERENHAVSIGNHVDHDPTTGCTEVFGTSMVFHCNHYNRTLQQFVEDPDYVDSEGILLRSAAETVYRQTREFFRTHPDATYEDTLAFAEDLFTFCGFGTLDLSGVTRTGGVAYGPHSHYGEALKLNVGDRETPGEYLDRGFLAGVLAAAAERFDLPLADGFVIEQPASISLGNRRNRFEIGTDGSYEWLEMVDPSPVRDLPSAPERDVETQVDEAAIIEAVADLDLTGNDEGLIPAFGLYLTRNYADYYNKSSFRFLYAVAEEMDSIDVAVELLAETGHLCGFYTFGGIMTSPEWDAVVEPMIETSADWIHGMVAIINALGWGIWRVEELVPGRRLVIRAYDCYESLGHLRWFGEADRPVEFLVEGGATALMNLVYYGDVSEWDGVDDAKYYDLFKDRGGFDGRLTRSIATGDDYVEAVVTR